MNDEQLHYYNNEPNKEEKDEDWNFSCDTSDLSDFKYELEIE